MDLDDAEIAMRAEIAVLGPAGLLAGPLGRESAALWARPVRREAGSEPAAETLKERFREVMAGVATPVSVITTLHGSEPHGATVSAFASLSMEPPMVLVSLDRRSTLLAKLRATGVFGVNILGVEQAGLALDFATRTGAERFDGVAWTEDRGVPRLADVPGWLACEVSALLSGGDHIVALGMVKSAETKDGLPLTYHRRSFGTHAAKGS